jgi:hypothetical protein
MNEKDQKRPQNKKDTQSTQMAGEFLAVAKLFKLRHQASVTFGNAKGVDVLVYNPSTDRAFAVQVKTLREPNWFQITREAIMPEHIYVFIILHEFGDREEFFLVPGKDILADINKFFRSSYWNSKKPSSRPGIWYRSLEGYRENWTIFDGQQ